MQAALPEIVAPAGNLETGIYAFKGGADAVYFGLSQFSARGTAENLTMQDVRRLKGFAENNDKKIFAALNTVIAEDERKDAMREVRQLALLEVDGVIVQDLGLAFRIQREFPDLPLHGSTQLAVHTALGLEALERLSFQRVVLSRELSLDEIAEMNAFAPKIEREVFVHGALCYGFSGLCLASSHLTKRSGNRGECAQICRSWFDKDAEKGYFFSAADLAAGSLVQRLTDIGVRALKIEGRLKSSAYAFNTSAYYRALLNGDPDKSDFYKRQSALCFARPQTVGFLQSPKKEKLISLSYPSHIGIPGAVVLSVNQNKMLVRALTDLASRDRLFRLPKGPPDEGETLVLDGFLKAGKRVHRISSGDTAEVRRLNTVSTGDTLMKTLSHDMHLKSLSKGSFVEKKAPLTLEVDISTGALRLSTLVLGKRVEAEYEVTMEKSRGDKRLEDILRQLFGESKDHAFTFGSIMPKEGKSIADDIFIPPSMLKAVRNDFYEKTGQAIEIDPITDNAYHRLADFHFPLPNREDIRYSNGFMFVAEGAVGNASDWPKVGGVRFVCLPPVMFQEEETLSKIEAEIDAHPDEQFMVGLNNVAHMEVALQWNSKKHVTYFIDYGLYAANLETLLFFIQHIERLQGAYLWLEATERQRNDLENAVLNHVEKMPIGLRFINEKERFPMFISRICFHRSFQKEQACPNKCPKRYVYHLKQNQRAVEVRVIDCISYVHLVRPARPLPTGQ